MKPVNILMVDDQPSKLLTYDAILGPLGQNLLKAQSAREAMAHLLREDVAVVLMDVNMPELDGFELAAMIREHPRCQRTAIIFVSGVHLSDVDRLRGYEIGAVDYVSVPVVPAILRAKVGVFVDLYHKSVALEELNRTLEERVLARTTELENLVLQLRTSERRLIEQGAALAEQDRRKNVFLAMLAHELRNPLQPICMILELARGAGRSGALGDSERQIVERQVGQLVRLVDDLLDASRIASGKLELRRADGDLAVIVESAIEAVRALANQKGQALTATLPPHPVAVHCDAVRLTQVLQNLLNNSIKFTPRGGSVALHVDVAGGDVVIRVTDTGAGFGKEECARVFEMFYQGPRDTSTPQAGLGLGLALVKQLVELHEGTVSAHSNGPGQGCEFVLRLPIARAPAAVPEASHEAAHDVASKRILVVDDNQDAADSLVALLCAEGSTATALYSGRDAIASVAELRPEIVVLDLGMPDLDGYETARAIREVLAGQPALLVALTGWGGADVQKRARAAGFDVHLVKPVTLETLMPALGMAPAR